MRTHYNILDRMKFLMEFCDEMKVYFRSQNNILAEQLFSQLEFKSGIMYEQSSFYILDDIASNHPNTTTIYGEELPVVAMKLYEVQNLIITHYISVIESSLREFLLHKNIGTKKMILNAIIEHLFSLKIINQKEKHLWNGIRQIRNAIVHYDSEAHITEKYHYTSELIIQLHEDKKVQTTDILESLKLMEWMTYSMRKIILKF